MKEKLDWHDWIEKRAKFVLLHNGKKRHIRKVTFLSPCDQSAHEFELNLRGGGSSEQINWSELLQRFKEYQTAQTSS